VEAELIHASYDVMNVWMSGYMGDNTVLSLHLLGSYRIPEAETAWKCSLLGGGRT